MNRIELPYRKNVLIILCSSILTAFFIISCASIPTIDPTEYLTETGPIIEIPDICQEAYDEPGEIRLGVVDFSDRSRASQPGWAWWREVEMMLPETVADGVIDELVNIGGAGIFTRTEMERVLAEHEFQMSGLVDDETIIDFARLAGLSYIVTGSVNDVNVGTSDGSTNANVDLTIRMIDVTTGQVVLSERVSKRRSVSGTGRGAAISAIKRASSRALEDLRPVFSSRFTIRGYIIQTRVNHEEEKRIALINIGSEQAMREGYKVNIYTFQEVRDPFTGESMCDKVRLPVEGVVTTQIQDNSAWILLEGDFIQVQRIQTGALVERAPIARPGFLDSIIQTR